MKRHEPSPTEETDQPEPVGPIAEQLLDRLAAQPDDPDLAARRRAVLDRLRRPHTTRRKEQQP